MNNRQKLLIIILSCILVIVMSYRLLINPYIQELSVLKLEYDTAEMSYQNISSSYSPEISDADFFENMTSEEISLMISELFENNGIELLSLSIGEAVPFSDNISAVSVSEVTVSAEINTNQLRDIIDRINDISSADIKSFDAKNSETEITIDIYYLTD
ncbi:MAG TPA: hypothetical protein DIW26_08390 [Ruminococcus sp.]|nr:hypothetical protein [Ruminococcus sp.]